MSATGAVTVSGTINGLLTGTKTISASIVLTAALGETLDLVPTTGNNIVTVPTGATAVLIAPSSLNAATLTLKGTSGDTGVGLHPTNPTLIALQPGLTSFIIGVGTIGTIGALELSFV